jgi:RNA polymerase sigma-70 factor (ECF subfamily)
MIDEATFYEFVKRHKNMLWHICTDYSLGRAWQVEDAFQEVLCSLWTGLPTLRKEESERAWAYRVATNTLQMLCRKPQNRPTDSLPADLECRMVTDGGGLMRTDYSSLQQLINRLGETDRRIVRSRLDGFSFKEIGDELGISRDAAAQRYNRAIKRIKQQYENEI